MDETSRIAKIGGSFQRNPDFLLKGTNYGPMTRSKRHPKTNSLSLAEKMAKSHFEIFANLSAYLRLAIVFKNGISD